MDASAAAGGPFPQKPRLACAAAKRGRCASAASIGPMARSSAPPIERQHAEEMQRVGVARRDLQALAIERLGPIETAGAVMRQRRGKRLRGLLLGGAAAGAAIAAPEPGKGLVHATGGERPEPRLCRYQD
jgi:hypothetical protein